SGASGLTPRRTWPVIVPWPSIGRHRLSDMTVGASSTKRRQRKTELVSQSGFIAGSTGRAYLSKEASHNQRLKAGRGRHPGFPNFSVLAGGPGSLAERSAREEHWMAGTVISHFEPDADRLAVIRECMEHYDVGKPGAEWPNNIISRRAVVYGSGGSARPGGPGPHAGAPHAVGVCRRVSRAAAEGVA